MLVINCVIIDGVVFILFILFVRPLHRSYRSEYTLKRSVILLTFLIINHHHQSSLSSSISLVQPKMT